MRVELETEDLRPLVAEIVREVVDQIEHDAGRIGYPEKEAARLLGMAPHQLRDRRMEGAIKGKRIGRSYYYTRRELEKFIQQ